MCRCSVVEGGVAIEATAATVAGTGVEMEAMTAASIAALTVYDMTKALDKGIRIRDVVLLRKSGGKSGEYRREICLAHANQRAVARVTAKRCFGSCHDLVALKLAEASRASTAAGVNL